MTKKILIIEDERDIAAMIKERLEKTGYQAEVAFDGGTGLEKAKTTHPDLIILDLNLPILDGYKICEQLKSDERYKKIPIIILSARGTPYEEQIGLSLGADAYVKKPYEPKTLYNKVEELLE